MEPLRIELENFLGHRHSVIDCSLFTGALIVAKGATNDDVSNGAGKTTIFHAIEYVLFGKHIAKTLDELVRWGTDQAKVTFDFKMDEKIYRIERSRNAKTKKSDLRLYQQLNGVWPSKNAKEGDLTQKTSSEVEAELADLIKITRDAFRNSVLFAQDDLVSLSSVRNPSERKNILKEVLGLNIYSKLEKLAKDELSLMNKRQSSLRFDLDQLGNPAKDLKELEKSLKSSEEEIAKLELSRKEVQGELRVLQGKLATSQQSVKSEFGTLQQTATSLAGQQSQLQKNLTASKQMLLDRCQEISQAQQQLTAFEQQLTQLKTDLQAKQAQTFRTIETVEQELNATGASENKGKAFIMSLQSKIRELSAPLPVGENCSHCRQTLTEDHRKSCMAKMAEEIEKLQLEFGKYQPKLATLASKKSLLEKELKEIRDTDQWLKSSELKISSKEKEIKQQQALISKLQEMSKHLQLEGQSQQTLLQELMTKELEVNNQLAQLNVQHLENEIQMLKKSLTQQESQLETISKALGSANALLGVYSERIKTRTLDIQTHADLTLKITSLDSEIKTQQKVVQSFSASGIPTMIIYTMLDDLQIEANKFLAEIRPGIELQFSILKDKDDGTQEDTLELFYRINGCNINYELISGGQKYMVALALRLGLSVLIQQRLGVNIKFLELDEVDQRLDKAAIDALAILIKKLQEKFKIFMITHNDRLKDKFNHAILVDYHEQEGSTAKVVTSW